MKKTQEILKILEILKEDHQSLENTVIELKAHVAGFLGELGLTGIEPKEGLGYPFTGIH